MKNATNLTTDKVVIDLRGEMGNSFALIALLDKQNYERILKKIVASGSTYNRQQLVAEVKDLLKNTHILIGE